MKTTHTSKKSIGIISSAMNGFTLDLKPKEKRYGKRKRTNVFGEKEGPKKKSNIRLTHVDEYQEISEKKLVIVPRSLRSSLFPEDVDITERYKYGLITLGDVNRQGDTQEPITLSLFNESTLPDTTRDEEYAKVPVEEFGEALLRGMGWDGREDERDKDDPPLRRYQFSGIGAKILPNCNNGTHKVNKRHEDSYMPLVKVDRKTGEKSYETR